MSQQTIVCVTDEEPQCFHPAGQRGFAVRLSVRTDAADEATAQGDVESFLDRLGNCVLPYMPLKVRISNRSRLCMNR